MANRFWVGDGGNWSDSLNHWSASDGGAANASKPTSSDNVFFTSNSFTIGSQSVTVDESANCLDMDWTGATDTPTFAGTSTLNIYGSLTFIVGMTHTYWGVITFRATSMGHTITTAQKVGSSMTFDGVGGGWTLQDNLDNTNQNTTRVITLSNGALNLGNRNVISGTFAPTGATTRSLTLGSGTITLVSAGAVTKWNLPITVNLTFDAGTSTIIITNSGANAQTFKGGDLTYNNLTQEGAGNYILTISGSNTFNVLTIDRSVAAKTVKFTDGTTQTVTSLVIATSGTTVVTLQGTSTGGWVISDTTGSYDFSYLTISYSTAEGGATWQALTSNGNTDDGNNSGWIFSLSTRGWMRGLVHSGRRHRFVGRR